MFTGLVQRTGTVKRVSRGRRLVLEFGFEPWDRPLEVGESVAVNGACLTVCKCSEGRFTADILRETEMRTGLGSAVPGTKVNLERAIRAGEPFGGHVVQGHVDTRAKVVAVEACGRDRRIRIRCGRVAAAQTVLKGSVAIDGVSLTVTEKGEDSLAVDIIPETLSRTTLGSLKAGDEVNVETDVLGKYALQAQAAGGITEQALIDAGFVEE